MSIRVEDFPIQSSFGFQMGDRYKRKGTNLMERAARDALRFHQTLENTQRAVGFC